MYLSSRPNHEEGKFCSSSIEKETAVFLTGECWHLGIFPFIEKFSLGAGSICERPHGGFHAQLFSQEVLRDPAWWLFLSPLPMLASERRSELLLPHLSRMPVSQERGLVAWHLAYIVSLNIILSAEPQLDHYPLEMYQILRLLKNFFNTGIWVWILFELRGFFFKELAKFETKGILIIPMPSVEVFDTYSQLGKERYYQVHLYITETKA